jgi:hypothetical protein
MRQRLGDVHLLDRLELEQRLPVADDLQVDCIRPAPARSGRSRLVVSGRIPDRDTHRNRSS